jgi:hypothetical protein
VSKSHWLVLVLAILGGFNAGIIWMIQFSCYPLWPYVGRNDFSSYYAFWQQTAFGLVTLPSAMTTLGAVLLLFIAPPELPRGMRWTSLVVQASIQLASWLWLRPIELRIASPAEGLNAAAFQQLLAANWLRIGLVTAYAGLAVWMVARCLWVSTDLGRDRRLLLVTSALSLYGLGNVWLVQVACYRLWQYVGRREAYAYHNAWWHSIWGVLFIPAGIVFLGSFALLRLRPIGVTRRAARIGLTFQLLTYGLTAVWWGPLMARLVTSDAGLSLRLYHLLMTTHWLRVGLVTAYAAACCSMLVRSATRPQWKET